MRWWMAALLAIICISAGMLIPLPAMEYTDAFIPTEETAPPLVNIGMGGDGTPRPMTTLVPSTETIPEAQSISLAFSQELQEGVMDALYTSEASFSLSDRNQRNGLLMDLNGLEWFRYEDYTASRAALRLALIVSDGMIQITDTQTQAAVLEIETASLCDAPAYFSWDQDVSGNVAVCVMDENKQNASTVLYESSTGDQTLFEGFGYPRFSPDGQSLYLIEQGEIPALYRVSPLFGQPKRITADTISVHSQQPVEQGVIVRGMNLEAEEGFLLRLDDDGAQIADYHVTIAVTDNSDSLFPVDGGHAYYVTNTGGSEKVFLIDSSNDSFVELAPGEFPVSLHVNQLLLRNGLDYYLIDRANGGRMHVELLTN